MVTNEEAADIVIQTLKDKGFGVISRDRIIADIKSIRERKLKGTKDVTDKWKELPNNVPCAGSIMTGKKYWCDCGDGLVSEEDLRTGICGICRSLETGYEELPE